MALVRDSTPPALCFDEAFVDVNHTVVDFEDLHHHSKFLEECLVGSYPWGHELPMAMPGGFSSSSTFVQDGGWANMPGVSFASPPSSSVVTSVDGYGEEYCAAWTDDMDKLSYDLAPGHAASSSTVASNCFSFGGHSGGSRSSMGALAASQKRPRAPPSSQGAEEKAVAAPNKKQCGGYRREATKPSKEAPTATAPKETQNLTAKNRRERISERLRLLQELVPNGSKVDTVTMLNKAITYVRFMQLQLKVLETDAFWSAPGGQAPNMSQVKEALHAILSSAPFS